MTRLMPNGAAADSYRIQCGPYSLSSYTAGETIAVDKVTCDRPQYTLHYASTHAHALLLRELYDRKYITVLVS